MPKLLFTGLLFSLVTIAACRQPDARTPTTAKTDTVVAPLPPQRAAITVSGRTAVFISPDSVQIAHEQQQMGEEDFYTAADDYVYYTSQCGQFLDSMKVKIVRVEGKPLLRFTGNNGQAHIVDMDTVEGIWNLYLFEPGKPPYRSDMLSIEEDYQNYFR